MKFTNAFVLLISMMSIALLNSCSSLPAFMNPEKSLIKTEKRDSEVTPELLTPIQSRAKTLQTMPNLYKEQADDPKTSFSTQTRDQFQEALALKKQGKFPQAREVFMTLSEQHPDLSGIWLQLALLIKEQDQGDTEQRHKDMSRYLNNAISANSLNYLAHNELAMVLRQQGQFYQALSHYELALKSWPAFAEGYLNRGILYDLYMGEKSLALDDYELYKALSNDSSRQLKGWIIDLQRQIKRAQQVTQSGAML
jgi:tetratricopeptide (TPR) repeat protein